VNIINAGNGALDTFFLALNPPSGLAFSNPTNGVLNATSDTIFFYGTALGTDEMIGVNEIISTTYTIEILSCSNANTKYDLGPFATLGFFNTESPFLRVQLCWQQNNLIG
jgi:hypothetical protein